MNRRLRHPPGLPGRAKFVSRWWENFQFSGGKTVRGKVWRVAASAALADVLLFPAVAQADTVRAVDVIISNHTSCTLLADDWMTSGAFLPEGRYFRFYPSNWTNRPNPRVEAGRSDLISTEGKAGTSGSVTYETVECKDSTLNEKLITFKWNSNRQLSENTYTFDTSASFLGSFSGPGQGDKAVVKAEINEA
ncbi:hypothetical protein ACFWDI_40330 [Streptomyces sp. NPDC060064]|uniref:hypothetical protein n=1 Tax=Streptomyces sp. NPDC060064 TaxID=3347049 RepID=UPI0036B0116B